MKTTIGELKTEIAQAIGQKLLREFVQQTLTEVTVKTADGKTYTGEPTRITKALVQFGTTDAERQAIMAGRIPINQAALRSLIKSKAVESDQPARIPKPYDWEKDRRRQVKTRQAARNKFQVAVKKFARNWRGFTQDQPDTQPEDAASDAAESFFWEYPEWKEWAAAMSDEFTGRTMSKTAMKEIITDFVHDEMLKGAKNA